MGHTFTIDDNPIDTRFASNPPEMRPFTEGDRWKKLDGETVYSSRTPVIGGTSPLFHSVGLAFNSHCPLVITPDNAWLTILNGLVHHIDSDPEGLRHHFVQHEGKLELEVRVSSPPLPNVPGEVWEAGVNGFSSQLQEHIGKKADLIVCDFSTTSHSDRLSSQIAMMGAMKHYFTYKMMLLCGMSRVTVAGTPEDWDSIYGRVMALSEFDLKWWTDHLAPVILELKRSCEGNTDLDFWRSAYLKQRVGSGGDFNVSGWINTFHPYIAGRDEMRRNECVDWQSSGRAVDPDDFPSGLVSAPVELDDHGTKYDFKFYGGLVGVSMEEDFTVQAVSGWAIQNLGLAK